ncbi:hypothetical protein N566_10600 [Streptomycetaceae bacterium MP113-05]|nr:hypothetical protein N566_10600 [Streptomycetaceae bacterium MP113-05]
MSALATGLTPAAGAAPAGPAAGHVASSPAAPEAPGPGMEIDVSTRPVAPGAALTSFARLAPGKWLRGDALSVDLEAGTRVDHLSSGRVSERRTVSEHAEGHDPGEGRRTVAAINADFFDINATGAPLGPGIRDGEITQSPEPGATRAVGFGPGSAGRILDLYFEGTLALPDGEEQLAAYNAADVPQDGIGAYNAQWGTADRAATVEGAADTSEVAVRAGRVVRVSDEPGDGAVPQDTTVLLGRDHGSKVLDGLEVGDPVSWEYRLRTDDGGPMPRTAVGGRGALVVDGQPQDWEGRPNNATAPRTAVGFSQDGSTMHVLTVDGRQAASGGATLTELARMMDELGAYNALNLDGGGSSTLVAREPGSDTPQLENAPSDGRQREVPNGLALTARDGSGELRGFWVETAADPVLAPTADTVPGGHPERVFPGLTRQLKADGYDETYGPAEGRPDWRVDRRHVGRVDDGGAFHARRTGSTEVTARRGRADGAVELRVIGALRRVAPTQDRVGLATGQDEGAFGVLGFDTDGTSAPIDPADVSLEYDRSLFRIEPDVVSGGFTVTARTGEDGASGIVKATVAGHSTALAVTVGLRSRQVAAFDDAGDWTFSAARATGEISTDPAGHEGQGLRLDYDFGQSTATRAAYVNPPRHLDVPGQPQAFTLWVKGDGRGAWPSLHLIDGNGTSQVLRGPHITWRGWRQVTFTVPGGVAYPVQVRRFYVAETRPAEQYGSSIVLDELVARTPPDVELPDRRAVRDRLIGTARDVTGRDWRFAVMSDAQFVARQPDSELVRQARRTLREIRAADPDFVVINGDLVDEGAPEDLAFAREVIEEELGDAVPWHYVPGNHEVMGGSIENFVAEFGPARRTFDHKGTKVITLDTSSLSLQGLDQFAELRRQLDAAARDPRVRSVAVVQHVPPRDPAPQQASRLTDRMEADLLENRLAAFHTRTGKDVLVVGSHVGVFHASRVDGVPYLVNGNSGKGPAAPPGEGGFTGWSMVGVERHGTVRSDREAFRVQTRPHVDALALDAPTELGDGETARVAATVRQGEGSTAREVPVTWPVSADWSGSRNLCADDERPKRHCDAAFDAVTGVLTALRPGTVSLVVEVNGARTERTVVIE